VQVNQPLILFFDTNDANSFSDYYHIRCFERIADFSQADYLDRVTVVDHPNRHLTKGGYYPCDAGAQRIVLE